MPDIEGLISDLAFILLLGAVVTVLFKWIRQPVVLGYIVAGFLASPHFEALPSVTTEANIEFWAQLGIIVLLFSLGLEFSFRKLLSTGGSAVVTALIIVAGMMLTGFLIGRLLHFSAINCLFLGGMLSMSSTTIIIKAFTDLGLRQKKFASLVFAVLIVEDLFAVVMMVVLSSVAVNKTVESGQMLLSVAKLVFFLVIWFMAGVFLLPSALNSVRRFLNSETLLVVSMGLCLAMALFSVMCGFSLALGAFVMGSILAGTSLAEPIEHVTAPVKDLFGAVFFISVGMMVQPAIIAQYWAPILLLSAAVVVGMIVFGTFGMLVTGQSLRVAIESGFSLTQIGEFAFIIATLGMSLGVLDADIYPIVVAVSVITTFTTPYFIRMAPQVASWVEKHLPERLHFLIDRYTSEATVSTTSGEGRLAWLSLLKRYLWRILLYSVVLIAITVVADRFFLPWLQQFSPRWWRLVGSAVTLVVMSPFLLALSLPPAMDADDRRRGLTATELKVPRIVMMIFRLALALAFIVHILSVAYSLRVGVLMGVGCLVLLAMLLSKRLKRHLRGMEARFIDNLNERELRRSGKKNNIVSDLHIAYMRVGYGFPGVGEQLRNNGLRSRYGVSVVTIQRGQQTITVPSGERRIFPGDVIGIVGTDAQIEALLPVVENDKASVEADEASGEGEGGRDFTLRSVVLGPASVLLDDTAAHADLRRRYHVHMVALQRGESFLEAPAMQLLRRGDRLWLVGSPAVIASLE